MAPSYGPSRCAARQGEPGVHPFPRAMPIEKAAHSSRKDIDHEGGEELYRLLVESVRDYAIFALDPKGFILTWNPGAERFKGYKEHEIVGQHFSVFYTQEDRDRDYPGYELEVAAREGRFEDEGWRLRKDGTRFWANVVITALRDPSGKLVGFAKVTRDLTERKNAEARALEDARRIAAEETARSLAEERAAELAGLLEQLHRTADELERRRREAETANRAKSDFLAAMSHELRTPLNAIGGYASLLEMGIRGPITDAQREDLNRITRSQAHLLSVINDILNFSRIEAGRVVYNCRPVTLREVVDSVESMITVSAAAKGLQLEIVTPPDASIYADPGKVEQILLNLLANAVKFTGEGGRVTLRTGIVGDRAHLVVQDTGLGIPADQLESIFEPFVQVGRGLSTPSEGTGLGLAISRDLARAMGGDLHVQSEEGVGSTFTVTLPLARP
jgi:PAS domain S-box-containing protein